jgi:hypothetical protein
MQGQRLHSKIIVVLLVVLISSIITYLPGLVASTDKGWCDQNETPKGFNMDTQAQICSPILNLSQDQFFQENEHLLNDLQLKILESSFKGIAINAPKEIDTAAALQLPVFMANKMPAVRAWEIRLKKNCIIVAMDQTTNHVYFNRVFPEPRPKPLSQPRVRPENSALTGISTDVYRFNAQERLELPWETGQFSLAVISYDWVSNQTQVMLKGKKKQKTGSVRTVKPPINPNAGATEKRLFGLMERDKRIFPSYLPGSKTPKLSRPGLSFKIDPKPKGGAKLTVDGVFITTAKAYHMPEDTTIHQIATGQEITAGAIVPLRFALVGLDQPLPRHFDWAIPVYNKQTIPLGGSLQGYFTIDILAHEETGLIPGKYAAYIIMESEIYGPETFEWSP